MVFAIGKAKSKVINGRVSLPAEYHLKNRDIYGAWYGENALFLSDAKEAFRAGSDVFSLHVDSDHRLRVEDSFEDIDVDITGCVSTIQLLFKGGKHVSD